MGDAIFFEILPGQTIVLCSFDCFKGYRSQALFYVRLVLKKNLRKSVLCLKEIKQFKIGSSCNKIPPGSNKRQETLAQHTEGWMVVCWQPVLPPKMIKT